MGESLVGWPGSKGHGYWSDPTWMCGTSGYHRSVLESVLFDSYISDLDEVRSVLSSSLLMTPS